MRGGKRPNAGLKQIRAKELRVNLMMSQRSSDLLTRYAKGTGLTRSDLLDALIVMHLNEENRDIIHCPKCHQPVAYSPMIPVSGETEFTCKCGHTFIGVL